MDFRNSFYSRFEKFGRVVIKTITTLFKSQGKTATGKTVSSLRNEVSFSIAPVGIELKTFGDKAFDYIREGRKPGEKMPPQGALLDYMKKRGIPASKEWGVRKNIADRGIAPDPILDIALTQISQSFFNTVSQELLNDVSIAAAAALPKDMTLNI